MSKWLTLADTLLAKRYDASNHDTSEVQCTGTMALAFMLRHIIAEMEKKT